MVPRQDGRVEVLGVPELHLHLEVDNVAIPDADGFVIRRAVDKDVHGVHHILKGRLRSKAHRQRVGPNLAHLMRLDGHNPDTEKDTKT
jgi:hypothetical protein